MHAKNMITILSFAALLFPLFPLNVSQATTTNCGYDPVTYDDTITFTASLQDGKVVMNWSKYHHSESFTYYKVIRSQTNNDPVYPDDGYIYFTGDMDTLTYTDTSAPTGKSYYRVCQIASLKRYCSLDVIAITNSGTSNQNMNDDTAGSLATISLTGAVNENAIDLSWQVTGEKKEGYKIVWSNNEHPTYPGREGDQYHYLSDNATLSDTITDLETGTYYVRVCIYSAGACTVYSNELMFQVGEGGATQGTFIDVPSSQWAYDYIMQLRNGGVIQGKSDGLFHPGDFITRAEFVKMVIKALFPDLASSQFYGSPFYDVHENDWFVSYIIIARNREIISGYADGMFKPNGYITRAEAAAVIAKALQLQTMESAEVPFTDVIAFWQKIYIKAVLTLNIVSGYNDTSFGPNDLLTRDQAAKIVYKAKEVKEGQ